jgi:ABC-type uncharacterized transport system ATPase subunit
LVKDILKKQRDAGKTIIMCTHQMNQVEQLCDKIVLVDKGEVLLYGGLQKIYESFATDDVHINTSGALPAAIPGVQKIERLNTMIKTGTPARRQAAGHPEHAGFAGHPAQRVRNRGAFPR